MEYSLGVQPYSVQDINCYNCQYESYPPYPLLIIDKESYIVEAKIENSDSGWIPMGRLVHNFQIGRYCSLAGNLHFLIGRDKNYFNVTTSAAKVFQLTEGEENWKHHKGSIILQNDVWVGSNSSFVSGVIVHNGAIVAAHSHVVKDVPPYAIVGGNPARVIGWRFDKEIIDKLQTIQWWYWSQEKLEQNAKYFNDDIVEFCDRFYDEAKAEVERVKEEKIPTGEYDSYLCVIDDTDAYMVFPSAMNDFVEIYSKNKEKNLFYFT